MAHPKPTSFEPLASSDPVPADTEAMTSLGQQYAKTVSMIKQQVSDLRKLTSNTSASWKSHAGSQFVSKASNLAGRIEKAEQRYETAATALKSAAGPMHDAQQQAYAAVHQAQEAEQTMKANAPAPAHGAGAPKQTAQQKADAAAAAKRHSAAQDSLSQAQNQFNNAVDAYQAAAKKAASQIDHELNNDPLKDSWFQQHFWWLMKFIHYLSIAIMVLALVAAIIACPAFTGLLGVLGASASFIAGVGTVGTIAEIGATVLSVVGAAADGLAAGEGLEKWDSFAIDIAGLVTCGFGKVVGDVGKGVTNTAEGLAKDGAGKFAATGARNAVGDTVKNAHMEEMTAKGVGDPELNQIVANVRGNVASKFANNAADEARGSAENAVTQAANSVEPTKWRGVAGLLDTNKFANNVAKLNGIKTLDIPGIGGEFDWLAGQLSGLSNTFGAFQYMGLGLTTGGTIVADKGWVP